MAKRSQLRPNWMDEAMKIPGVQDEMMEKAKEILGLTDADYLTGLDGKRYVKIESLARGLGTTPEELMETTRAAGIEPTSVITPNVQVQRTIHPRYGSQQVIDGRTETCFTACGLLRFYFELEPEDMGDMAKDVQPLIEQFQRLGKAAIMADKMLRMVARDPQDVLDELFQIDEVNKDMLTGDPLLVLRRAIERATALRTVR